jgi:hypothetical protein
MTEYLERRGAFAEAEAAVRKAAGAHEPDQAPKPYSIALAKQQAASTATDSFEAEWKARRLRELDAARARAAPHADNTTEARRFADGANYTPPKPYTIAVKAMKEAR